MTKRSSKWHILDRRNSPKFLQVQDWEQLPYHVGLRDENIQLRRNVEKCPEGLEPFVYLNQISIFKPSGSQPCSGSLFCKATRNKQWLVFSDQWKKGKTLFRIDKLNHYRASCVTSSLPTEFAIHSKKRHQWSELLHCTGLPGIVQGIEELLFDYFIQIPDDDKKPILIELGGELKPNSCSGLSNFKSAFRIFNSRSEYSHQLRKNVYHISVNIDNSLTLGWLYKSFVDGLPSAKGKKVKGSYKNGWTLEFARDLKPLTKALLMCTAMFIIDEK